MGLSLNIVKKFFPQVTSVVDATRKARIEVTQKDVSSKAVKDHNACAMAVACKRKFNLDGVIISRSIAYLIKGKQARRFKLPMSISREIVAFDRGAGFEPGVYEFGKPNEKLGSRVGRKLDPNRDRSGKNKRFRHLTTNVRHVLGGQDPDV